MKKALESLLIVLYLSIQKYLWLHADKEMPFETQNFICLKPEETGKER